MSDTPWEGLGASMRVPSPLESLGDDRLEDSGIRVFLKRDDLIHPEIPGNKWRKLKYNLIEAAAMKNDTLLTFGGAYSNHIRATAAAGYYCKFSTIGIIRGEEHLPLNQSLAYATSRGMRLSYMDRVTYRRKSAPDVISSLRREHGSFYLLPEGGSNELAVQGCSEVPAEIETDFNVICCPCGTGGTLAGIAAGLKPGQRAIGFSSLKGGEFLADTVTELQRKAVGYCSDNWSIEHRFHFGGFARKKPELDQFIADFRARHALTLEWVYVAKMMYGIYSLCREGAFSPGTRIVAVITGPAELK
ncbi:MAG TPA: pyridoxal-phosphate dependent enzyme [Streptosporangiaceae bacterium]|jgi:1-aminocyclopropane-1-carboxylate deaminase